ncbi:MAG TPA: thermonuclease family protein [Caulifigura sp.]|jgi:micrococcal nuclease|nr:thermonuclease family protein [Caulifigura sp.]
MTAFDNNPPRQPSVVRRTRPQSSILAIVVFVAVIGYRLINQPPPAPQPPAGDEQVRVARVVDGDTLLLENRVRVRLLGVNTPETKAEDRPVEPWGPEASEFTEKMVGGKLVTLEYDRERVDDYGRTLAYVYVDGKMLNEALIEAGLSEAVTRHPYRSDRKKLFEAAEARARAKKLGIWSGEKKGGSPAAARPLK